MNQIKNYNSFDLENFLQRNYPNNPYQIEPISIVDTVLKPEPNILFYVDFPIYPNFSIRDVENRPIDFTDFHQSQQTCSIMPMRLILGTSVSDKPIFFQGYKIIFQRKIHD